MAATHAATNIQKASEDHWTSREGALEDFCCVLETAFFWGELERQGVGVSRWFDCMFSPFMEKHFIC